MRKVLILALLAGSSGFSQAVLYNQNYDALVVGTSVGWTSIAGAWAVRAHNPVSTPNAFGESAYTAGDIAVYTSLVAKADMTLVFDQVVVLDGSDVGPNIGGFIRVKTDGSDGYLILPQFVGGGGQMYIFKRVAGTYTELNHASIQGGPYANGNQVRIKAECVGATIRYKSWIVGTAEPVGYGDTQTDGSVTAAGVFGFYSGQNAGSAPTGAGATADNVTVTSTATPTTVPVTNSNVQFSPYNWFSDGGGALASTNIRASSTYAESIYWGAYFKMGFTGTSFAVSVDTSTLTGHLPALVCTSDNGPWTTTYLMGNETTIPIVSGLADASHTVECYIRSLDDYVAHWTTPTSMLKVTGFTIDPGKASAAPSGTIAIRPKNCLFYGDSITEGEFNVGAVVVASIITNGDAGQSYPVPAGKAMNCEWGNAGLGGTGWVTSWAAGAVPAFTGTYDLYYAGNSRLFSGKLSPIPDYMFVNYGTNDASSITSTVISMATTLRGIVNAISPIFILTPFGQQRAANITTAFASISDPWTFHIDLGTEASFGLTGTPNTDQAQSFDGIHPKAQWDGVLGAMLAAQVRATLSAALASHTICGGSCIR